jgi:hypothetical protein
MHEEMQEEEREAEERATVDLNLEAGGREDDDRQKQSNK